MEIKQKADLTIQLNIIQGDHSADTEILWQCAALVPMLSDTHSMPVVLQQKLVLM